MLTAVVFTDIVGSTEHAARLGDQRWRDVLGTHEARARAAVERAGGRIVKSTGDGLLVCFDGAARAVRCAQAIVAEGKRLDLGVRAGVHAGDCEQRGDDVLGLTVHVASRVAALAGAGEVLVSAAVRDMVRGSALAFADRGRQALRGVPDEWLCTRFAETRPRADGFAGCAREKVFWAVRIHPDSGHYGGLGGCPYTFTFPAFKLASPSPSFGLTHSLRPWDAPRPRSREVA